MAYLRDSVQLARCIGLNGRKIRRCASAPTQAYLCYIVGSAGDGYPSDKAVGTHKVG